MSAAVNSIIGAQSDSIGRGAEGSESREESGTLESRALQRTGMVFSSIDVEIAAPEAVSSHPSSVGAVGSELRCHSPSLDLVCLCISIHASCLNFMKLEMGIA